ncbi:hypothetical protein PVL29_024901 [Vitis rotundifolia]|uniref:Uncharacterized protein n=1 Tax=Vitis rotundifolia TaxID=103349 RepID=A0AA38YSZ7_VITRO|nr:hypothetical protein PVL29_024901 [Vitis rotundifolia]
MGRVEEDVTIAMAVVGASAGGDVLAGQGAVERVVACGRRQKQGRRKKLKWERERKKRGSEKNLRELEREPVRSLRVETRLAG